MVKMLRPLHLVSWFVALLCLDRHVASCSQQILSPPLRLRNATLADADDIAAVMIAAFSPLPWWNYTYQFRDTFPHEHTRCARWSVTQLLLSDANAHTEVIEAPTAGDVSLVAAAIWIQKPSQMQSYFRAISGGCTHKDMNITRALDFDRKFTAAKRKYVDNEFGTNQLYLQMLGTHPDYQGRGAGTRLVKSGLERGREERANVTLIAQPTAESFYLRINFTEVVNITIPSVDGERDFRYNVMMYEHHGDVSGGVVASQRYK